MNYSFDLLEFLILDPLIQSQIFERVKDCLMRDYQ